MKKTVILCWIVATSISMYSQETRLDNTLLWRISGKGLSKPSYLYGTMHLMDKRVFNIGDSVYKAIEKTEGFAAELDMTRVGIQVLNYAIADRQAKAAAEKVKVKDVVSPLTWERYKAHLAKKFYKDAEEITVDDLEKIESSLTNELYRKGDMPTFLDAYLFDLARKQGKWVGGLEELEEQIAHINDDDIEEKIQMALFDDDYYRSGIDKMIKIYSSQRLDSIDALMYREESGKKDYIMIKRNLKMTRMMDSLSAVRTTFFAVGAAHLPGDSGVVALLRQRGFTVEPVVSGKKISADKYVVNAKEAPWAMVNLPDSAYSIQMPGEPGSIETLEEMGLNMKVFFDISAMKMYMTIGMELPEERRKLGLEGLYNSLKSRYSSGNKPLKENAITVNGIEGREFITRSDDGEFRMQVFIPGMEYVIFNGVFAFKEKALRDAESGRFFQSLSYGGVKAKPATQPREWSVQRFPQHAFSIELPIKPREKKDVNTDEGKITYEYQWMDIKSQSVYGMNVYSTKEGLYDTGLDSNYFLSLKNNLLANFTESSILDSSFISIDNHPGFRLSMKGKTGGEQIEAKVLSVIRGNRQYYIYVLYSPSQSNRERAGRFMESFNLLPYNYTSWKVVASTDNSYSVISPFPMKKHTLLENDFHPRAERFIVFDSVGSTTTFIDKTIIPSWCWFSSDTAFLRQRSLLYKEWNDSVLNYTLSQEDGRTTVDLILAKKGNYLAERVKLILSGNELYELFGHYDHHDLDKIYSRFFNQFTIHNKPVTADRSTSRMGELTSYIKDADKDKATEVSQWWHYLSFDKSNIAALQGISLRLYPDFDSSYSSGLNNQVFETLATLDSTDTTIDYLKAHYKDIDPKNESVKPFVISYLSGIKKIESYGLIKDFFTNYSFDIDEIRHLPNRFYDSLRLTATLFPGILKHVDLDGFNQQILYITTSLVDSGLISKDLIRQEGKRLTDHVKKMLDKHKEDEEFIYRYYPFIPVLGMINTPESNNLLARFAKFSDRYIQFTTLTTQLKNNLPADKRAIFTMATTDEYRQGLYLELKKLNKLKLFPPEFLSQKQLAQSQVYVYANDDSDEPLGVTYVGERVALYEGKQKRFYLFKVSLPGMDAEGPFLAVAGPYSLDTKDVESSHDATDVYWDEKFDAKKIDALFKDHLLSIEKWRKAEEEEDDEPIEPPPAVK